MRNLIKEFQVFIARGNVIDLAVGIIIGGAFGTIVQSLVNDIIMPPIGLLLNDVNFNDLFITLSGDDYASLQAAKDAGAATLNYGLFITNLINFLIIAFVVFLIVKQVNMIKSRFENQDETPDPTTKKCPYCLSEIAIKATRCPNCTSHLDEEKSQVAA